MLLISLGVATIIGLLFEQRWVFYLIAGTGLLGTVLGIANIISHYIKHK